MDGKEKQSKGNVRVRVGRGGGWMNRKKRTVNSKEKNSNGEYYINPNGEMSD